VLMAFGTGLRMSELFGLKWHDIDFEKMRSASLVPSVPSVGLCKTEASQKPVPLDSRLAEALHTWRQYTSYRAADDWVFASRLCVGKNHIGGSASCEALSVRRRQGSGSHSTLDGTLSDTIRLPDYPG